MQERGAAKRTGESLDMPDERQAKRSRSELDANAPAYLPPVVSLPQPVLLSSGLLAGRILSPLHGSLSQQFRY